MHKHTPGVEYHTHRIIISDIDPRSNTHRYSEYGHIKTKDRAHTHGTDIYIKYENVPSREYIYDIYIYAQYLCDACLTNTR